MGLLEDINSGKYNLVIIIIGLIFIFHIYWTRENKSETMSNVSQDIKDAIQKVYNADVESIRNLAEVSNKLVNDKGLILPGNANIRGRLNVGSNADAKDFPEWLSASVEHAGDSHIRLKTKNDDNKNVYLIDRDGNFRLNTHGVGDMFGVNRDGHTYNVHTGDHVHHFLGRGDNPYITISKEGEWSKKSWYLQNVKNDGNNKIFRIGVHDEGSKLDIHKNGNAFFTGEIHAPSIIRTNGLVLGKQNRARYIRVGNKETEFKRDYWTLIELKAYDHNGNNVAAGKPVTILEGSGWNGSNPALITDNKVFNAGHHDNWSLGFHGNPGNNVLQIDLGQEFDLAHIELFNRWNADLDWRMDGTTVEFLGADGKRNRIIYTGLWHRQYSKEYVL